MKTVAGSFDDQEPSIERAWLKIVQTPYETREMIKEVGISEFGWQGVGLVCEVSLVGRIP